MKTKIVFASRLIVVMVLLAQTSCKTSNTTKAGAIGAGTGAILGGIIGHSSDNAVVGAIIGSAVGGTAGALIGNHMDKQAEELKRDLKGAHVQRVGEGILITFTSGLKFEFDSFDLGPETKSNLNSLATTLKKYDDTSIRIEGHTDNVSEVSYNQEYLANQGVNKKRVTAKGYGEQQPLNGNLTEEGSASK